MLDPESNSPPEPSPATLAAAIEQVLHIAATTAQMASAVALLMHRRKLLMQPESEHLAKLARHLGELFEGYGHDDLASDFAAQASLLRQPPPS